MNLCKTNHSRQSSDTQPSFAEYVQRKILSNPEETAALIYTTAYHDGYLEAQQDTLHYVIKCMIEHHFDYETIQNTLDISQEEIKTIQTFL